MKLALIGAGAMGANHARVIAANTGTSLAVIVDPDISRANILAETFEAQAMDSIDQIEGCDAAVLASPTSTHLEIAEQLLSRGIPLLVEKPFALRFEDSERMVALSRQSGIPLMCGFVERFNPAIREAKGLLEGPPLHIVALRHSPRPDRTLGSVVHDVAIHDVDLCVSFCGEEIRSIKASGWTPPGNGGQAEIVDASITFGSGALATISASRWTQRKIRHLSVAGAGQLIEIDMLRQNVTVYRHVQHQMFTGAGYRAETVVEIPFVRYAGEPLSLQLEHFTRLVRGEIDAEQERVTALAPHAIAHAIEAEISRDDP